MIGKPSYLISVTFLTPDQEQERKAAGPNRAYNDLVHNYRVVADSVESAISGLRRKALEEGVALSHNALDPKIYQVSVMNVISAKRDETVYVIEDPHA